MRDVVIQALGKIGGKSINILVNNLADSDPSVRKSVAKAIGKIGSTAVSKLEKKLKDPNPDVRAGTLLALAEIGEEDAVATIIKAFEDKEAVVRRTAIIILKDLKAESAAPSIARKLITEDDDSVKSACIITLGELGRPETIQALSATLDSSNKSLRIATAMALAKMGEAGIPALTQALSNSHPYARETAAIACGQLKHSDLIPSLIEKLGDSHPYVRKAIIQALIKIGEPAITRLIRALGDGNLYVREGASGALGAIGKPAIPHLIKALSDSHPYVREASTGALGKIGKEAVGSLVHALEDDKWYVREAAALALGQTDDQETAAPALIKALTQIGDYHPYVRKAYVTALGQIKSKDAVPALIERLSDNEWYIRQAAAQALGETRSQKAVPALAKALADSDQRVSKTATEALGKVGSPAVSQMIERLGVKRRETGYFGSTSPVPIRTELMELSEALPEELPETPLEQFDVSSPYPSYSASYPVPSSEGGSEPTLQNEGALEAVNTRLSNLDEKTLRYVTSLIPPGSNWTRNNLVKKLVENTEEQRKEIKQRADLLIDRINQRLQMIMERIM
jgi:HEAT repeat protein